MSLTFPERERARKDLMSLTSTSGWCGRGKASILIVVEVNWVDFSLGILDVSQTELEVIGKMCSILRPGSREDDFRYLAACGVWWRVWVRIIRFEKIWTQHLLLHHPSWHIWLLAIGGGEEWKHIAVRVAREIPSFTHLDKVRGELVEREKVLVKVLLTFSIWINYASASTKQLT